MKPDSAGSYVHGEKKAEKAAKQKLIPTRDKRIYQKAVTAKNILAIMDLKVVIKTMAYSAKHRKHHYKKSEGSGSKKYSGHHQSKSGHKNHAYSTKHTKHHYAKNGHKNHSLHSAHSSKEFFKSSVKLRINCNLSDDQVESSIEKMRFDYRKSNILLTADKEVHPKWNLINSSMAKQ